MTDTIDTDAGALTVETPDGTINPLDFNQKAAFKHAVYEYGVGTWLDDFKLGVLYERAHDIDGPATAALAEVTG